MIADSWRHELDVALALVRNAALLARDIRHHSRERGFVKADQSPVTVADFAVQALAAHRLGEMFPDDPLVAEEDASTLRTPAGRTMLESVQAALQRNGTKLDETGILDLIDRGGAAPAERFWVLDPVDGTQGFVRGDQYVVALALIVEGLVEIGLLGCPELSLGAWQGRRAGWLAFAARKRGAFGASLTGDEVVPLRVSSCRDPRLARVLRSVEADHIDLDSFNAIVRILGVQVAPALMDSQAKHAVIAAGGADMLIRVPATKSYRDKIWDQAAGSLIIEEAGGRVTDLCGASLDFRMGRLLTRNMGVIASNGRLHSAILDAYRDVTTEP